MAGWKKLLFEDDPPTAHESTHVSGGSDEIDSALADAAIPNLAAGKITSDRFPVDRLPAMTDEKIWKGTGTNVEEVDWPDLATHEANTTTAHGAVSAATASKHVVRDASARAKFAAPAAAGDALIKGTRVTVSELPAMTDEKIWKGTGANVEEVDFPTGWTPTGNGGTKVAGADCEAALKDPVAAVVGLRTLGAGGQQAAAGDHTHTLVEDILGEASSTLTAINAGGYIGSVTITTETEVTLVTKTQTYDASSLAVGVAWGHFRITANTTKVRLYMDGVQMAESAFLTLTGTNIVLMATKVLSGEKTCSIRVYNSDGSTRYLGIAGTNSTSKSVAGIAIGSIKI